MCYALIFAIFSRSLPPFQSSTVTLCPFETDLDEYLGHTKCLTNFYLTICSTKMFGVTAKYSVSIDVAEGINPMECVCYEFRSTFTHTHNFLQHLFYESASFFFSSHCSKCLFVSTSLFSRSIFASFPDSRSLPSLFLSCSRFLFCRVSYPALRIFLFCHDISYVKIVAHSL